MADDHAAVLFDGAAPAAPSGPASVLAAAPAPRPAAGASPASAGPPRAESDAPKADASASTGKAGTGRKRVFTFQTRWMHSLPIMERSLPESVVGGTPMKPRITDAAAFSAADADATSDENTKDVVVCMLCDDPASKRDAPKIWSRVNCRRGRIENHLWSKHPEFMMLLKQKQEAENDLAVQIFLQSMRDGRCDVRNEIGAGLYTQLHSSTNDSKRALEEQQASEDQGATDSEAAKKRAKVDATKDASAPSGAASYATGMAAFYPSGGLTKQPGTREGEADGARAAAYDVGQALPGYNEAPALTALSSWSISLLNKVVVLTGGDNEVMMNTAAQLWSLGANVLITFSDRSMLDVFMSTSLARCPETHEHLGIPRGVMLPLLCEFTTHKQLDDWSRSIAARFPRVHCLINYVNVVDDHVERSSTTSNADASSATSGATEGTNAAGQTDTLGSTLDRLRSIAGVVTMHCVPVAAASSADGHCTVINVTSHVATSSNAVRAWTQSVAQDALPKLVHANFIEVPGIRSAASAAGRSAGKSAEDSSDRSQQTPQLSAATTSLLHTVALLCSPAGRPISGSVLRIESDAAKPTNGAANGDSISSESGSPVTSAPANGAEDVAAVGGSGEGGDNGVHVV